MRYPRRHNVKYTSYKEVETSKKCRRKRNVKSGTSINSTSPVASTRYPFRHQRRVYKEIYTSEKSNTNSNVKSNTSIGSTGSVGSTRYPSRLKNRRKTTRLNLQSPPPPSTPSTNTAESDSISTTTNDNKTTPTKLSPEEIEERNLLIEPLVQSLFLQKLQIKNKRIPRCEYMKIVTKYQKHFKWISIDTLKQRVKRKFKKYKLEQERKEVTEKANVADVVSPPINKGGRPVGTTAAAKVHTTACMKAAKSEITDLYEQMIKEKNEKEGKNRASNGSFQSLVQKVKTERNLPESFQFSYYTARNRLRSKIQLDDDANPVGNLSPLFGIEQNIVDLLIILGKTGSPVPMSHGIKLINEMIDGTIHQKRLITYKKIILLANQKTRWDVWGRNTGISS
jgi:hypothetical protein